MSILESIKQLKYKPEPVKRKIFFGAMAGFAVIMVVLYVISIRSSIAYSLDQSASRAEGLPGEFQLPGIKDSIMANVKDIMQSFSGKEK